MNYKDYLAITIGWKTQSISGLWQFKHLSPFGLIFLFYINNKIVVYFSNDTGSCILIRENLTIPIIGKSAFLEKLEKHYAVKYDL